MWKSTSLILAGLIAGWLLHGLLAPRTVLLPVQEHARPPDPGEMTAPGVLEPQPSPVTADEAAVPGNESVGTVPDAMLARIGRALELGSHADAVGLCVSQGDPAIESCREVLLQYAGSPDVLPGRAIDLLEQWLLEFPDDIDAGIMLVEFWVSDEKYVEAARRLALLKSYLVDPAGLERVGRMVQSVARPAIIKLTLTDDRVAQESLLKILVEMEPERATWHYSLAKVQYDLLKYDAAINTLSYILFDPDYGDRAARMHDEISKKLDLAEFHPISLVASGSHFLVNARINGSREIRLLLDTGASITSINRDVLTRLGIDTRSGRNISLHTAGGTVNARTAVITSFDIGGYSVRDIEVAALEFDEGPADGLLGMNFLDHFRYIIDQKQRKLFLTSK